LRHAQDLMRHVAPDGDLAVIVDRALTLLIQELERTKCAAKKSRKPRSDSAVDSQRPRKRRGRASENAVATGRRHEDGIGGDVVSGARHAGRCRAATARPRRAGAIASDSGRCETTGLGARWRPVRIRR
jgi:hypothetical protein